MDWASVFDFNSQKRGASDDILKRFVSEVARPMSAAEVREINSGQSNPFPEGDPLYGAWQRFDSSKWLIPERPLPPAYLSLLRWSNGGEFRNKERLFQFFPALSPHHGVRAMMLGYFVPEYMPGALPVAFDGCGTFYMFDLRRPAVDGEYPVVCAHSGNLSWEPDACNKIAESFEAACCVAKKPK